VKWSPNGVVTALAGLPGADASEATGVNNLGQIVGYSSAGSGRHAVEWNAAGVVTDLGIVPGAQSISSANGINDLGEVVGLDNPTHLTVVAVRWINGQLDDFGTAEQDDVEGTDANAVNDFGEIVGSDYLIHGLGSHRVVRWNADGSYVQLPYLTGAGGAGSAEAINNLGVVVGSSPTTTLAQRHAVRWDQHGNVTDLGTVPGGIDSAASGINDLGAIAGSAIDANGMTHAVAWNTSGVLRVLPALADSTYSEALAVSDAGLMVGDAVDSTGHDVAVYWR
jgi:probable HAF family extracellular repeat protein